jgi:hypothetical protein
MDTADVSKSPIKIKPKTIMNPYMKAKQPNPPPPVPTENKEDSRLPSTHHGTDLTHVSDNPPNPSPSTNNEHTRATTQHNTNHEPADTGEEFTEFSQEALRFLHNVIQTQENSWIEVEAKSSKPKPPPIPPNTSKMNNKNQYSALQDDDKSESAYSNEPNPTTNTVSSPHTASQPDSIPHDPQPPVEDIKNKVLQKIVPNQDVEVTILTPRILNTHRKLHQKQAPQTTWFLKSPL